eukprot:COSAG02_NODE_3770_length_6258_cov_2588.033447_4_plen_791_part_00
MLAPFFTQPYSTLGEGQPPRAVLVGEVGLALQQQQLTMPPPGYRSAASRATPTQPLVVEEEEEEARGRGEEGGVGLRSNTWVGAEGGVGGEGGGGVQPVRRRLLGEESHSPPDGPTDSPHDGEASAADGKAAPTPSPAVVQRIGATDSPHDSEEARLDAQLAAARVARETAQKDARKKRQIASGGVVSWVKLSRLYNSQGFFSPRRSRFVRRHPVVDVGVRLVILVALLITWAVGTIFAPGLALGVAPAGGPFPLPSSMRLIDMLPLAAIRNPQASGIALMSVSALVFCALSFTLLHPRLATPIVSLFVSASVAQGLATFYDIANDPVDSVVTASVSLALLLGAAGSAASQCSTQRLRSIFSGFWKPGGVHQHHPAVPPLAALAVWLGISLGGLLGPALVSGSPRVTFDPSPWLGLVVMASGLGLLGAVAWYFFHPRLFVALLCGGVGLFGGGLIATQIGDDTADGRKFVGIGIAIMIMCCGAAVVKGRKLCCSCGGAHNAHESHGSGRDAGDDFSSAILSGPTKEPSSEYGSGGGVNTDWAGNTPSKRRGSRSNRKTGAGEGSGSAVARAHLEFDSHSDDRDQQQATEARQRRRRIHFADEPTPGAAAAGGTRGGSTSASALVNVSPSPAKPARAARSPATAGSLFEFSGSRQRRSSTGGDGGGSITNFSADLENQASSSVANLSLSPNAAFQAPQQSPAAAHSADKDTTLHSALSGLRKMLHDRAEQLETPTSPSPHQSAGDSPDPGAGVAAAAANFRHAMSRAAAEADAVSTLAPPDGSLSVGSAAP